MQGRERIEGIRVFGQTKSGREQSRQDERDGVGERRRIGERTETQCGRRGRDGRAHRSWPEPVTEREITDGDKERDRHAGQAVRVRERFDDRQRRGIRPESHGMGGADE